MAQLGLLLLVLSGAIFIVALWSGFELVFASADIAAGERQAFIPLLLSAGIGCAIGVGLTIPHQLTRRAGQHTAQIGRREALLLVAMSWLIGAAVAGLPYFLWAHMTDHDTPAGLSASVVENEHIWQSFADCYFEAMSGLTTTGATVLSSIEVIPRSILLWRATTHWLGGLGIVVLFVAVLPSLGVGGKKLFRVESPGPTPEGVRPHIRETARILWFIYCGITLAEILALWFAGMSWFEATCHTFATLATGGFSTLNASVGGYRSVSVDVIIIVFMLLAGVNFGLYDHLIHRRFKSFYRDPELRLYLIILAIGSAIVVISLLNTPITTTTGETLDPSVGSAVRHGVFTVVSVQTTTGFCTADFNNWPQIAQGTLILLMFIGASAGSTGGGIKVIRVLIAMKVMVREIERSFRPSVIRSVKAGHTTVAPELKLATLGYILGVILIFLAGMFLLLFFERHHETMSFDTALSASAATLCNIGPGLGLVGAVENYSWFSMPSKIVMSLLMAVGRLEVFAIVVLLSPRFWRGD
ncbi:MAG: TrkH family potassium uptake protein [Planctomycetes bacterium]|nr:TrkH family potassium uptake protein [Planctomycetota bacterium]